MHEWEESKTGIKKHYRKILYPTLGVALAGTTTAAVALPIMIKKIATQKTMDILSKILPISDQVNSLQNNAAVAGRGGKVNYLAIGDSVTAGYNGYLSSNGVIEKDVMGNPIHAYNPAAFETKPDPSNYVAIKHQIDEIDTLLKGTTLTPEQRVEKTQLRKFLVTQMEDHAQHTTGDYLSFADFLANDLHKAGKLNDYRNFALTGATMPNLRQTMLRNTTALACIKQADLISLSIGANDMLAAVEVLRLGFGAIRGEADTEKISQFNAARDAIKAITDVNSEAKEEDDFDASLRGHRGASASTYASKYDTRDLIKKSFNKLVNMMEAGTLGGLFDIQQELLDHIFDLIQLDLANTIKEINAIAPNAKIIVMGYAFPFHLLPSTLIDAPIFQYDETKISSERTPRTLDGKHVSLKDVFMHLNDTIKDTLERAKYVKYFNINDLKEFSKESDTVTYTLLADGTEAAKVVTRPEWDRVMPNPLDIHPSTYGHQVISGHLYEWVAQDLGLKNPAYQSIQKLDATKDAELIAKLETIYTYTGSASEYHDAGFEQKDELVTYESSLMKTIIDTLSNKFYLQIIGAVLPKIADPAKVAEHYQDLMDGFKDITFDKNNVPKTVDDIYGLVKPILNTNAQFGNVQGFTVGKFFDKLIDLIKSVHWDRVDLDKKSSDGTTDTNGILNDVIEIAHGDGIQLIELITLFGIYFGDEGKAMTVDSMDINSPSNKFPIFTIPAHEPLINADPVIAKAIAISKENNKDAFAKNLATVLSGQSVPSTGDATLRMLAKVIPMNIGAPASNGTDVYLNLVKPDANGHRVPWMDPATGEINFDKVLDEIVDLGKSVGMDISVYTNGLTKAQKDQWFYSLWNGDNTGVVYINEFFATMGVDVAEQSFWRNGGDSSVVTKAAKAGINLRKPFDELYPELIKLVSRN